MTDPYNDALLRLAQESRAVPTAPTHAATARNRFCADTLRVALRVDGSTIREIGWHGDACVICRASASRICDLLHGAPVAQAPALAQQLSAALSGAAAGPFAAFAALQALPSRHTCARLPLTALQDALRPAQRSAAPQPTPSPRALGDDPWSAALAFRERGQDVAIATLVDVVGSSPCPIGSHMVVAENGEFWGAVSGGCVESAVVQAGVALLAGERGPEVDTYQIANSQAGEVGLPCGGQVRIHVGPAPGNALLRRYRMRGDGLARVIDLAEGTERLETTHHTRPTRDGETFIEPLLPSPRLVLVGGTRIAQSLAKLAAVLGYDTTVVEPREGFAGPNRFDCPVRIERADAALRDLIDHDTAVVMLTHDERIDDPGLEVALGSEAFYVGALGSRKTQRARLARLAEAGLSPSQLARLRGPAGLAIGAIGAEEIALSILAEITATRRQQAPRGVGAVVLAAGSSRRAGPANKLLQPIDGVPMVRRAVCTALEAARGPCVVVLGHEPERVRAALRDLPVQFVDNPEHAQGMGTSIAAGIEAVAAHNVSAAFVVLGDMPWLKPSTLQQLAAAHTPSTQHLVVVPVAGAAPERRRGNPVLWPERYFDELRALRGDTGGKAILARAPGAVLEIETDDRGVLRDVDTILQGA